MPSNMNEAFVRLCATEDARGKARFWKTEARNRNRMRCKERSAPPVDGISVFRLAACYKCNIKTGKENEHA